MKAFSMIFLRLIFDFSFIYKDTQQSDCLQIITYCKKSNHGLLDQNQSATMKAGHIYKRDNTTRQVSDHAKKTFQSNFRSTLH